MSEIIKTLELDELPFISNDPNKHGFGPNKIDVVKISQQHNFLKVTPKEEDVVFYYEKIVGCKPELAQKVSREMIEKYNERYVPSPFPNSEVHKKLLPAKDMSCTIL